MTQSRNGSRDCVGSLVTGLLRGRWLSNGGLYAESQGQAVTGYCARSDAADFVGADRRRLIPERAACRRGGRYGERGRRGGSARGKYRAGVPIWQSAQKYYSDCNFSRACSGSPHPSRNPQPGCPALAQGTSDTTRTRTTRTTSRTRPASLFRIGSPVPSGAAAGVAPLTTSSRPQPSSCNLMKHLDRRQ